MLRRVDPLLGQSQGFHMRVLKRKGEINFHFVTRSIDMYKDVFDLTQTHTHTYTYHFIIVVKSPN